MVKKALSDSVDTTESDELSVVTSGMPFVESMMWRWCIRQCAGLIQYGGLSDSETLLLDSFIQCD